MKYAVPVVWQMSGWIIVDAHDEDDASVMAQHMGLPDDGEYVSESLYVDDTCDIMPHVDLKENK